MAASSVHHTKSPKDFKALYKISNSPGTWKEKYRQRCFDNLKRNRRSFVDRLRKCGDTESKSQQNSADVREIMRQEWMLLKREDSSLPDITMEDDLNILAGESNEIENMLSVFDEIQEELKKEEWKLIDEYEQSIELDEKAMHASIDALHSNELLCPMCKKFPLMQNKNIIFCKCGLRVDTEQDCISLDFVRSNLEEGLLMHSEQCNENVVFGLMKDAGVDNLLMTCKVCDFMHIVI
ncbi:RPA-interacting protein-like [Tubulanus polymorphus]|uniref:RPA-interacting protein-like n=1 Tax=Tubulanus polymorphus TaxID=672921 RepID=UPI003DA47B3E